MDIIYIITDTLTQLKYLGSKKNWKGFNTYFGSPSCKNKRYKKFKLQQKWKLDMIHRPETFRFDILESYDNISHKELIEIELSYQYMYDVVKSPEFINAGYAKVGFCGDNMSCLTEEGKRERKENISKGLKRFISNLSVEDRQKIYARFGEKNGMFGKFHSQESKIKMSEKQKVLGKRYSIERKGVTFEEKLGKEKSDAAKQKISDYRKTQTGEKNPFFGKTHSNESKQLMSQKRKALKLKPVNIRKVIIDGIEYESLHIASIDLNVKYTTLWHRINSTSEKYKNYKYLHD